MDKPTLPDNPTRDEIIAYEYELWCWENAQIERLVSQSSSWMNACKKIGHSIDRLGRRLVYRVRNARGIDRYFNNVRQAMDCANESQFQPTRITIMPILPKGTHWSTPLEDLVDLIIEVTKNE